MFWLDSLFDHLLYGCVAGWLQYQHERCSGAANDHEQRDLDRSINEPYACYESIANCADELSYIWNCTPREYAC